MGLETCPTGTTSLDIANQCSTYGTRGQRQQCLLACVKDDLGQFPNGIQAIPLPTFYELMVGPENKLGCSNRDDNQMSTPAFMVGFVHTDEEVQAAPGREQYYGDFSNQELKRLVGMDIVHAYAPTGAAANRGLPHLGSDYSLEDTWLGEPSAGTHRFINWGWDGGYAPTDMMSPSEQAYHWTQPWNEENNIVNHNANAWYGGVLDSDGLHTTRSWGFTEQLQMGRGSLNPIDSANKLDFTICNLEIPERYFEPIMHDGSTSLYDDEVFEGGNDKPCRWPKSRNVHTGKCQNLDGDGTVITGLIW